MVSAGTGEWPVGIAPLQSGAVNEECAVPIGTMDPIGAETPLQIPIPQSNHTKRPKSAGNWIFSPRDDRFHDS